MQDKGKFVYNPIYDFTNRRLELGESKKKVKKLLSRKVMKQREYKIKSLKKWRDKVNQLTRRIFLLDSFIGGFISWDVRKSVSESMDTRERVKSRIYDCIDKVNKLQGEHSATSELSNKLKILSKLLIKNIKHEQKITQGLEKKIMDSKKENDRKKAAVEELIINNAHVGSKKLHELYLRRMKEIEQGIPDEEVDWSVYNTTKTNHDQLKDQSMFTARAQIRETSKQLSELKTILNYYEQIEKKRVILGKQQTENNLKELKEREEAAKAVEDKKKLEANKTEAEKQKDRENSIEKEVIDFEKISPREFEKELERNNEIWNSRQRGYKIVDSIVEKNVKGLKTDKEAVKTIARLLRREEKERELKFEEERREWEKKKNKDDPYQQKLSKMGDKNKNLNFQCDLLEKELKKEGKHNKKLMRENNALQRQMRLLTSIVDKTQRGGKKSEVGTRKKKKVTKRVKKRVQQATVKRKEKVKEQISKDVMDSLGEEDKKVIKIIKKGEKKISKIKTDDEKLRLLKKQVEKRNATISKLILEKEKKLKEKDDIIKYLARQKTFLHRKLKIKNSRKPIFPHQNKKSRKDRIIEIVEKIENVEKKLKTSKNKKDREDELLGIQEELKDVLNEQKQFEHEEKIRLSRPHSKQGPRDEGTVKIHEGITILEDGEGMKKVMEKKMGKKNSEDMIGDVSELRKKVEAETRAKSRGENTEVDEHISGDKENNVVVGESGDGGDKTKSGSIGVTGNGKSEISKIVKGKGEISKASGKEVTLGEISETFRPDSNNSVLGLNDDGEDVVVVKVENVNQGVVKTGENPLDKEDNVGDKSRKDLKSLKSGGRGKYRDSASEIKGFNLLFKGTNEVVAKKEEVSLDNRMEKFEDFGILKDRIFNLNKRIQLELDREILKDDNEDQILRAVEKEIEMKRAGKMIDYDFLTEFSENESNEKEEEKDIEGDIRNEQLEGDEEKEGMGENIEKDRYEIGERRIKVVEPVLGISGKNIDEGKTKVKKQRRGSKSRESEKFENNNNEEDDQMLNIRNFKATDIFKGNEDSGTKGITKKIGSKQKRYSGASNSVPRSRDMKFIRPGVPLKQQQPLLSISKFGNRVDTTTKKRKGRRMEPNFREDKSSKMFGMSKEDSNKLFEMKGKKLDRYGDSRSFLKMRNIVVRADIGDENYIWDKRGGQRVVNKKLEWSKREKKKNMFKLKDEEVDNVIMDMTSYKKSGALEPRVEKLGEYKPKPISKQKDGDFIYRNSSLEKIVEKLRKEERKTKVKEIPDDLLNLKVKSIRPEPSEKKKIIRAAGKTLEISPPRTYERPKSSVPYVSSVSRSNRRARNIMNPKRRGLNFTSQDNLSEMNDVSISSKGSNVRPIQVIIQGGRSENDKGEGLLSQDSRERMMLMELINVKDRLETEIKNMKIQEEMERKRYRAVIKQMVKEKQVPKVSRAVQTKKIEFSELQIEKIIDLIDNTLRDSNDEFTQFFLKMHNAGMFKESSLHEREREREGLSKLPNLKTRSFNSMGDYSSATSPSYRLSETMPIRGRKKKSTDDEERNRMIRTPNIRKRPKTTVGAKLDQVEGIMRKFEKIQKMNTVEMNPLITPESNLQVNRNQFLSDFVWVYSGYSKGDSIKPGVKKDGCKLRQSSYVVQNHGRDKSPYMQQRRVTTNFVIGTKKKIDTRATTHW